MLLLDTSAILTHFRREPGANEVGEAIASGQAWVAAGTWFELGVQLHKRPDALVIYRSAVAGTVDVTQNVADAALLIRRASGGRIPAMDSLIAGAAKVRGYRLVHRDSHFGAIPPGMLDQLMLPSKTA